MTLFVVPPTASVWLQVPEGGEGDIRQPVVRDARRVHGHRRGGCDAHGYYGHRRYGGESHVGSCEVSVPLHRAAGPFLTGRCCGRQLLFFPVLRFLESSRVRFRAWMSAGVKDSPSSDTSFVSVPSSANPFARYSIYVLL